MMVSEDSLSPILRADQRRRGGYTNCITTLASSADWLEANMVRILPVHASY